MARFAPPPGNFGFKRPTRPWCRRIEHTPPLAGEEPDVPPGMTAFTRGNGTFGARFRLKAMGGRWHPDILGGVWLVPADSADAAEANIRLAERTGQELPLDDETTEKMDKVTCYVCGKRYHEFELRTMKHAVPQDWYCGCTDRAAGPPPRVAQVRSRP